MPEEQIKHDAAHYTVFFCLLSPPPCPHTSPLPSNLALIQPLTARPRFTSRPIHVGFVVEEMTLGRASLRAVRFQPVTGPSVGTLL